VQLQAIGTRDAAGTISQIAGTIQDVTELKEAEQRIRHLAYYDGITGLPNRQFFLERLQHALAHCRRHRRQLAVLSIDLDQFKRINDTLGHSAGNELLVAVAQRLSEAVRDGDACWRAPLTTMSTRSRAWTATSSACCYGLNHYHDAAKVARRLMEELRKPFRAASQEVFVSASLGWRYSPWTVRTLRRW
jgi:GGDEF domain-containing protein